MLSHFQKRFVLLKQWPFLAFMFTCLFAALGNGLGYVAIGWVVMNYHANVSAMSILMACFWGPNVFLGPLMGVLADRLSRQWMIVFSDGIRGFLFIGFSLYFIHHSSVHLIYFMMFCVGIAFSAFYASISAFMRELVASQDLMYANSIIDIVYEIGTVVGTGFAGLLIAWSSTQTAILINGIAFMIATITTLCIPKSVLCHGEKKNHRSMNLFFIFSDFQEGFRYLVSNRSLIVVYLTQLLILITFLTTPLLLLPFCKTILHTTVQQFGFISVSCSVGVIIGGLFMPWISEVFEFIPTVLFFSFLLSITFALFGYNRSIDWAIVLYFIFGFASSIWPLIITRAQNLTDIYFQGRVQSTFNSLTGLSMLSFYFAIGVMGKYVGVNHLYWIEVIITLAAIALLIQSKNAATS